MQAQPRRPEPARKEGFSTLIEGFIDSNAYFLTDVFLERINEEEPPVGKVTRNDDEQRSLIMSPLKRDLILAGYHGDARQVIELSQRLINSINSSVAIL